MSVFKKEIETKRVIFNVRLDLAERLEKAKKDAKVFGKKLDTDNAIDNTLEKFLKKAEKRIAEMKKKKEKPLKTLDVKKTDSKIKTAKHDLHQENSGKSIKLIQPN
ncbi:hypothetical protein [Desulfonema magnum]|uniref:Uncharacterized protein n=1 Tax=Desulfonema magnum TaxID=45655 RepID=A0A975GTZ5_9BACT|nr:hypothetical protein [Desulfonema magnum]QTA93630.1 Uncharacterized protein dnm_097340 [Desulfonema magnum]